jgi:hypothetical protein
MLKYVKKFMNEQEEGDFRSYRRRISSKFSPNNFFKIEDSIPPTNERYSVDSTGSSIPSFLDENYVDSSEDDDDDFGEHGRPSFLEEGYVEPEEEDYNWESELYNSPFVKGIYDETSNPPTSLPKGGKRKKIKRRITKRRKSKRIITKRRKSKRKITKRRKTKKRKTKRTKRRYH